MSILLNSILLMYQEIISWRNKIEKKKPCEFKPCCFLLDLCLLTSFELLSTLHILGMKVGGWIDSGGPVSSQKIHEIMLHKLMDVNHFSCYFSYSIFIFHQFLLFMELKNLFNIPSPIHIKSLWEQGHFKMFCTLFLAVSSNPCRVGKLFSENLQNRAHDQTIYYIYD